MKMPSLAGVMRRRGPSGRGGERRRNGGEERLGGEGEKRGYIGVFKYHLERETRCLFWCLDETTFALAYIEMNINKLYTKNHCSCRGTTHDTYQKRVQ